MSGSARQQQRKMKGKNVFDLQTGAFKEFPEDGERVIFWGRYDHRGCQGADAGLGYSE